MGYDETGPKPEFEEIRKFFNKSALRQPLPYNILFHNVYIKACHKILNHHFYKPTTTGNSWANFNRHVASHLINSNPFGTKQNCIRLFMLLDVMTEIYVYESRIDDPRFGIKDNQIKRDIDIYEATIIENTRMTPERLIFGTEHSDISL